MSKGVAMIAVLDLLPPLLLRPVCYKFEVEQGAVGDRDMEVVVPALLGHRKSVGGR